MLNDKLYAIVSVSVTLLLCAFYPLQKLGLALGFSLGTCFSYLAYEIRNFFVNKTIVSRLKKGKFSFNFRYFLAFLLNMTVVSIGIVSALLINKQSRYILAYRLYFALYPINIIAYLCGLSLAPLLICLQLLWRHLKERRKSG
ncbi:Uncharacterised protein [Mycoplasmopsis columbinasalis]|uniref:Uncharacterized protein n=1 Tax=Mycoplasmopsis columbinasalis TaxID=114880 RepID=A0A449B9W0_9BACT|nr:Uncharacterised protein [Mycoplasmopsis columbinasalis]